MDDSRLLPLKSGSLIVALATVVDYIWGTTLLMEPARTSSLVGLLTIFGSNIVAGLFCFGAAITATLFLAPTIKYSISMTLVLLMPQQLILMMASLTSFHCVLQGQFADGVERSSLFILSDQAWVIMLAYFHWVAMITWIHEKIVLLHRG